MSTVADERKAVIKELACDAFELDADALTPTARFDDDLGVDSLSMIDLVAGLEKTFGIEVRRSDLSRLVSLDDVYDVVAETAGWSQPASRPAVEPAASQ